MGGECSPAALFQSVQHGVRDFPAVHFLVFATRDVFQQIQQEYGSFLIQHASQVEFQIVADVIDMQDEPFAAIRHKKNSSLVLGLKLLKKGDCKDLSLLAIQALSSSVSLYFVLFYPGLSDLPCWLICRQLRGLLLL